MMDALGWQVASSNSKTDAGGDVCLDRLSTTEVLRIRWPGEHGTFKGRNANGGLSLPGGLGAASTAAILIMPCAKLTGCSSQVPFMKDGVFCIQIESHKRMSSR